jgi:diaminohydroxyphosphoribosylaminopyrimidine deaminase/5-amino-6-(5-phosphoribosylamino)uracil reductase
MPRKSARWSAADGRYMAMAFAEARKAKGQTLPNPPVGAVIVKGGKVVGRGGTQPAGQSHAEVVALKQAGKRARGGTLYVTLEPCSHHGRTPPCTDAILAAGIRKVVAAIPDPNPRVKGGGLKILARAGVDARKGLMEEEAAELYAGFFFHAAHGRPKIILKIAQSLDGRINARPGEETAVTGPQARAWTHALRARVDAVLIGGRTLRVDDPDLTPRLIKGAPHPEVVVVSRKGPWPESSRLFAKDRKARTWVAAEVAPGLPAWVNHVPLGGNQDVTSALLSLFEQRGYHSVLVEGGREMWELFFAAGLCDTLYVLTAPAFLPDGEPWQLKAPSRGSEDWGKSFKFRKFSPLGNDFLAEFDRANPRV